MKDRYGMSRREFLAFTTGMGVMAACPSILTGCHGSTAQEAAASGHQVSSAWVPRGKHEDSYDLFKAVVEAATDFSWLSGGDKVFLKLSLNSMNPFPATTDPWALECMIRLLREKGAGEISAGDQSGMAHVFYGPGWGWGSSRDCCRTAGLLEVMDRLSVKPCFFEECGYGAYRATYPSGPHHWSLPIQLTTAMDDVDHIIYLPRVGNHSSAGKTFGLKLAIGFLRNDSRLIFHGSPRRWQEMYEEINQVPELLSKIRLIVTSGRAVMTTVGPDEGEVVRPDNGLIFASGDLLAHDLLAAAWLEANRMGDDPEDIYSHPAIVNRLERMGGCPEEIRWDRINENPDSSITSYMENLLKIENCQGERTARG